MKAKAKGKSQKAESGRPSVPASQGETTVGTDGETYLKLTDEQAGKISAQLWTLVKELVIVDTHLDNDEIADAQFILMTSAGLIEDIQTKLDAQRVRMETGRSL